jgi:hypothetical protein
MGNTATRAYTTVAAVKADVGLAGPDLDSLILRNIKAATQHIENILGRRFIPETAAKLYRWPSQNGRGGYVLKFPDDDLLAVTLLQAKAQDTTPTTIVAADYFKEPANDPPYGSIEIDLSSSAAFEPGDTPQRSISVAGRWAYCEDTEAAGALAEADDGSETGLDVSDSSLIDVGNTILIGTEAMFVSAKGSLDVGTNTNAALTQDKAGTTVAVVDGTKVKAGEIITVESERMLVESVSGNSLAVKRAYDGSVLASHLTNQDIYAPRTMTVVRAVNGTTAAAHNDATAITKYAPPGDIEEYCRAYAINHHEQGKSGWTGVVGGSEGGAVETTGKTLWGMRQDLVKEYGRVGV